jgi:ribonucleoside-diphosphate reductase alpha chain
MSIHELQEYTRISRYARYNEDKGRRETWIEQVNRVMDMHEERYTKYMGDIEEEMQIAYNALKKKLVLGSQRALQFGGPSIIRKNARMYNCTVSYADRPRFFQEAMYLLLCGCGVGFSVQNHHVKKLPTLKLPESSADTITYQIDDSIEGWSDAIGVLLSSYFKTKQTMPEYFGANIEFDYSLIRPEGALISDTNGKAPGPEPLKKAMQHIKDVILRAASEANKVDGFRLRTIDVYDIVMHSSDAVLAGGVRRSATICMFSHDDELMINAKTGDWFITNPQRGRSNNSAMLIRGETTRDEFMNLMKSVREFGEPGFVWADDTEALYNPCVEIGMRAYDEKGRSGWSFCNLCEINVKKAKNPEEFYEMCKAAAILGTIQAGYARFEYLGEVTENIVKREALLGCSMTGMMDNPDISFDPEIQRKGAELIIKTNEEFCKKIGVNPAARTTCVKPAGSTSCILGTASGIHPHHAKRYFRRVQVNKLEEPLKFFRKYNPDAIGESVWSANNSDDFITFLCEVPKSARTKVDVDAIQLLDFVKSTQQNWVEYGTNHKHCVAPWLRHNVSNTINVRDNEWDAVADYIYDNRQFFAGISLLPMSGDKDYAQAPFQTVYTPKELVEMYEDASVFASGLIIHALKAFDGNLYRACDTVLGFGEEIHTTIKLEREVDLTKSSDQDIYDMKQQIGNEMSKLKWLARAKKFAENYFDNDLRKMTYCLKDVDAWKTWVDLKRVYKPVPWDEFFEGIDNTKVSETVACAGGSCEIKSM